MKWKALLWFFGMIFSIQIAGGMLTKTSLSSWYPTLNQPSWHPPDWVFAPVWMILYILIAVSGWLVFIKRQSKERKTALKVYAAQLSLNVFWSFLFFYLQSPSLALLDVLLLLFLILSNILLFWPLSHIAAVLLIPYLGWTFYALMLNAAVWWLNRY